MHISNLSKQEIQEMPIKELSKYLYPGDLSTISRTTGFSKVYIFYIINGQRNSKRVELAIRERVRQNQALCQFHKEDKG
jgi:ABC-type phosphonate transport system ATPase subunit